MDTTSTNFSKEISNDMAAFITKMLSEQRRSASAVTNVPPPEVTRSTTTTTNPTFHEPDLTKNKKASPTGGKSFGSTIEFFCYKDGKIGTVTLSLETAFSELP